MKTLKDIKRLIEEATGYDAMILLRYILEIFLYMLGFIIMMLAAFVITK